VTSWNRRLTVASARPLVHQQAVADSLLADLLADAQGLGVDEDGLAALSALATVARERPGFGTVLDVVADGEGVAATHRFAVSHSAEGPVVRRVGEDAEDGDGAVTDAGPGPRAGAGAARVESEVAEVLARALATTTDLVVVLDDDLRATWCNEALAALVPAAAAPDGHLHHVLDDLSYTRFLATARPALDETGCWRGVVSLGGDAGRPVSVVVTAAGAELVLVARWAHDVTPAAGAAPAAPDPVTGLRPAADAHRHLAAVLAGPERRSAVVLLVGPDQLRAANEHLGRDRGDRLLQALASRLRATVPAGATVTRGPGDQFVVVLPGAGAGDGLAHAIRIRDAIAEPVDLDDAGPYVMTASVGLAVTADPGGADAVIHDAERALAEAKAAGRDRIEVHTEDLGRRERRRLTHGQLLRRALEEDDVVLHYQPIVELATGRPVAAEALLRLREDGEPAGSPAELVGAAETSGLIDRVGARVLDLTCRQLGAWPGAAGEGSSLALSVNVAPRQLSDPELPDLVRAALEAGGADPARLCLEITERTLIGAEDIVDEGIGRLRELGVSVGLDDFGGVSSSLGYLKRFPLDFVKIHRTLVAGLGRGGRDVAIVRATVELAHELGMAVVAVGVESPPQLDALARVGCDRAQGHLFAPALSAGELARWLATRTG
jgi:diguanylate cyclase (GGDEF)-like protein